VRSLARARSGLTGFVCRCGHNFCGAHRHADQHNCTFDYAAAHRAMIASANPVVAGAKVDKI
jgi:hypothetical protein